MIDCIEALLQVQQPSPGPSKTLQITLFNRPKGPKTYTKQAGKILAEQNGVQPRQPSCLCARYTAAAGGLSMH